MESCVMTDRAWLEIDLNRLSGNIALLRSHLNKNCRIMAVVKANAYGLGAAEIARFLEQNEGIEHFAVASFSEGVELRKAGIEGEILILSYSAPHLAPELMKYRLSQAVASLDYAEEISGRAEKLGGVIKAHVKIDTGMTRTGFDFRCDEDIESIAKVYSLAGISCEGTFSHFASADDGSEGAEQYTLMQIERFERATALLRDRGIDTGLRHICNSGGIQKYPQAHFDMVRCGAVITGYNTACDITPWEIKPVASLKAAVTSLRDIPEGTPISYSRTFKAEKPLRVAVLSIGYADGYPRALSRVGKVMLNGCWARQLGNVCMDQMMIDVTDIPDVRVGDAAVIIGESGSLCQTADDLAAQCQSCMHEIMSRLSLRLQRIYLKDGRLIDIV